MNLIDFVRESNRIEGILREPSKVEIWAHEAVLTWPELTVERVDSFVLNVAAAKLRDRAGMNVWVGDHLPPRGGRHIRRELHELLLAINDGDVGPFEAHVRYETLHPFTDGNGRSGRAIWAWQMQRDGQDPFALGFLHWFYYQALSAVREHQGKP